ncbi:phage protein [Micromonospora sp. ATCC 39149]|uniref:phage minor capsid protein n=1 Tax=Micromonospora sp. (strain ATCC 39149 / NRRL 15099 / SCC 1413) TaxID=219305 RepID=UPI0001A504DA|nr:phage minor capsid protein [Micromonospora sp. ATCC 39149]EEP73512.1 phage protein [Micromonospora sp. ATCC 39149]
MALTGEQVEAVTRSTVDLYRGAEQAILEQVTRHLAAGMMDAPDWAVTRLGAVSALRRAVERILGLVAAEGADSIRETLAAAYRSGQGIATRDLPAALLPRDPEVAGAAGAVQTVPRIAVVESLAAALVADVGERHSNVLRHVLDVYRSVIQQATAVSVAGGQTRRQAAQRAYARFVDQGVVSFTDTRGRQWRLSSYAEMAVRTVTQRAAVQGQTDRLTTLGVDTVIVSDSPRECPLCRPWEGKVLSISGARRGRVELPSMVGDGTVTVDIAGSVEEARAAGLQHPNCTHSLRAFLPGATRRPARPTANAKGYEAKEQQRYIERQIRKWKERETAALDDAGRATAKAKVRQWQGAMRDHLAANPELKRLPYREQIGAGNVPRSRPAPASPAPRPTSAPPTVPDAARPYHRNVDGVEDLAATAAQLDDGARRTPLTGGVSAAVELVESGGTWLVRKRGLDWGDPDEVAASIRRQADAEQLASLLGRAIGAPIVRVYRDDPERVWMPWIDGRTIGETDNMAELLQGRDAKLLGLVDQLTGNGDRNPGNIMVTDSGRLVGIDHGFAWGLLDLDDQPGPVQDDKTRPARHFSVGGEWVDNPLTPRDVARLRQRLEALRPDFELLGAGPWLDYALGIVDELAPHAKGKVDFLD